MTDSKEKGNRTVLIFGASSRIAECTARVFASEGASLVLVARSEEKLSILAQDLESRGAPEVQIEALDLGDLEHLEKWLDERTDLRESVSTVLIAHGVLPDQEAVENDWSAISDSYGVNLLSPMLIATKVANWFESKGEGTLAVITSVAGVRARKSNYVYGAAKGGLSFYLQGLRNRFGKTKIRIIDIRPGFVDTPMTAHIEKGPLFASAEDVADGIVKAICRGQEIVYLPWFWRFIMLIIRSIPEGIFKKLSL